MAQTDPHKKADMQNLRTDVREKKAASHKVNKDLSHVKVKKAIHDHKAVAKQNKVPQGQLNLARHFNARTSVRT